MPDEVRIWEGINDIRERTARIESELRGINAQVSERCRVREERLNKVEARVEKIQTEHDNRMQELEKKLWVMVGASAVLSALATSALPIILKKVLS